MYFLCSCWFFFDGEISSRIFLAFFVPKLIIVAVSIFSELYFNGTFFLVSLITPHAQRERGKVIGCGVHISESTVVLSM